MIHLNLGSNLNSNHGSRFDNISIAIQLLLEAKLKSLEFQIIMKPLLIQIKNYQSLSILDSQCKKL